MKIVFFGTPHFAAELLKYLLANSIEVAGVVTQPDRPKGRSLEVHSSLVKKVAQKLIPHVPIFQPEKASEPSFLEAISCLRADLYVVVAFGQILPQKLLDIPPLGCLNVHASLLPKYRGAAPIQRALLNGEDKTGVAIQKMVKQLDAGDVVGVTEFEIPSEMVFGELEEALCALSKPLLLSVLSRYERDGGVVGVPQDHAAATYASKVQIDEGKIDWTQSAQVLHNLIRAFSPRPGAWCFVELNGEKKRLKILRSRLVSKAGPPGQINSSGEVFCGKNSLQLVEVQLEGKKVMKVGDWLRGYQKTPSLL